MLCSSQGKVCVIEFWSISSSIIIIFCLTSLQRNDKTTNFHKYMADHWKEHHITLKLESLLITTSTKRSVHLLAVLHLCKKMHRNFCKWNTGVGRLVDALIIFLHSFGLICSQYKSTLRHPFQLSLSEFDTTTKVADANVQSVTRKPVNHLWAENNRSTPVLLEALDYIQLDFIWIPRRPARSLRTITFCKIFSKSHNTSMKIDT